MSTTTVDLDIIAFFIPVFYFIMKKGLILNINAKYKTLKIQQSPASQSIAVIAFCSLFDVY